jgi:uncharacterized membrane protein (DUF106 family)
MGRTGEKARSLVAEDPAFAEALTVVLDRAGHTDDDPEPDGGTRPHTVQWGDVSDELTSGQWGRLIETGILHDADGDGFAVSDPAEVREALGDDAVDTSAADDDDGGTWTKYDKLAAVGAVALLPSYYFDPIRNAVGGTADLVLGPFDAILPFYAVIFVLSVLTGLYTVLFQSALMDTEQMGDIQERMSDIQERQKDARERGDDAALERIQQEQMDAMGDQLGMFKLMFRPMVWIMLVTIPAFVWMYWKLGVHGGGGVEHIAQGERHIVMPMIGRMAWTGSEGRILGLLPVWLAWYFICSFAFRLVIQKTLNLQTTPQTG